MADDEDLGFDQLEDVEGLDNCDNVENDELDEQIEPRVGMEFDTQDELYAFYRTYAKHIGFPMKRRSSTKNVAGDVRSVMLSCSCEGKHGNTSQNILKPQASLRVGCTAHLTARKIFGRWRISQLVLEHTNHDLSPSKSCFFRCNRKISAHVRHQINLNDQAGIRLNKNFGSLVYEAGGYENISCTEKDCRNFGPISKLRKGRPKQNRLKPTKKRSKKKQDDVHLQDNNPLHSQVGSGASTQDSMVSNPYVRQPNMVQPWGMYHPTQQFTHEHSLMSQFQMAGHPPSMAVPPMYGLQQLLPHQYYSQHRNNTNTGPV